MDSAGVQDPSCSSTGEDEVSFAWENEIEGGVAPRGDEKAICGASWGVICKSFITETGQETALYMPVVLLVELYFNGIHKIGYI